LKKFILLLIVVSSFALGASERKGFAIYLDQDMFGLNNEDRDYTMGLGFEYFYDEPSSKTPLLQSLHHYLKTTLTPTYQSLLHIPKELSVQAMRSFMFGTIAYTPDKLSQTAKIVTDRPYASLLFLADKRVEYNANFALGTELQVGILGTNIARTTQTWFHKQYRSLANSSEPVEPKGWDNQISDGGELTARFKMSYTRLIYEDPTRYDLAYMTSLSLGYQTNVSLGVSGRFGKIKSDFWSLPFNPINRGTFIPSFADDELYVWGAYKAIVVGYDALLQGQFRNSSVEFDYEQLQTIVHESAIGATAVYDGWQITATLNRKSAELKAPANRTHFWGGIYLIFQF
jgi:hypothetical protein